MDSDPSLLNEGRGRELTTDFRRILGEAAHRHIGDANLNMVFLRYQNSSAAFLHYWDQSLLSRSIFPGPIEDRRFRSLVTIRKTEFLSFEIQYLTDQMQSTEDRLDCVQTCGREYPLIKTKSNYLGRTAVEVRKSLHRQAQFNQHFPLAAVCLIENNAALRY